MYLYNYSIKYLMKVLDTKEYTKRMIISIFGDNAEFEDLNTEKEYTKATLAIIKSIARYNYCDD